MRRFDILQSIKTHGSSIFFYLVLVFMSACGDAEDIMHWIQSIESGGNQEHSPLVFSLPEEIEKGEVLEGHYLVAFKQREARPGLYFNSLLEQRAFHRRSLGLLSLGESAIQSMRYISSVSLSQPKKSFYWKIPPVKPYNFLPYTESLGPKDLQEAHLSDVQFTSEQEARRILNGWFEAGVIWYAEPNRISKTDGVIEERIIKGFNDEKRWPWYNQVGLIGALTALNNQQEKAVPVVAVLDSGVDVEHPALELQIYRSKEAENKLCRDDYNGCNTTFADSEFLGNGEAFPASTESYGETCSSISNCSHGTHVAGIIAGLGTDRFTGICPYCQILNVRLVDDKGRIADSAILAGLAYVSGFQKGGEPLIRIVNASFGKYTRSRSVELFIRALRSFGRGVLMVAASGNEGSMKRQYPSAFTDVLGIANIDSSTFEKDPSSNFGVWVDLAAPGGGSCENGFGILSSIPGNDYDCLSGTSMATPVVAAVAGLVLATNPNLNYEELRQRLMNGAVANELYKDGVNDSFRFVNESGQITPLLGAGVVNAYYATNVDIPKDPPAIFEIPERVGQGCAVIGPWGTGAKKISEQQEAFSTKAGILILLLLAPLLLLFRKPKALR